MFFQHQQSHLRKRSMTNATIASIVTSRSLKSNDTCLMHTEMKLTSLCSRTLLEKKEKNLDSNLKTWEITNTIQK